MSLCSECGYEHRTGADREACAAIHGRVRAVPEGSGIAHLHEYEAKCMLCGASAAFEDLLAHFYQHHGNQWTGTGDLVRFVL